MAKFTIGDEALKMLQATDEKATASGNGLEWTQLRIGESFKVRVMGTQDFIGFYSYGIFKKVNSFVAKNPCKRNAKGYPESDLTPWDLAADYHQKKAFEANENGNDAKYKEERANASLYRGKQRFGFGFIDLATGKPIVIDISKTQATSVVATITKYAKKLDRLAFELSKTGSGTKVTVNLTPLIDFEDDLTEKEQANFHKWDGKTFDPNNFEGLLYEMDDKEQIAMLKQVGFDVSLIGFGGGTEDDLEPEEINEDECPF